VPGNKGPKAFKKDPYKIARYQNKTYGNTSSNIGKYMKLYKHQRLGLQFTIKLSTHD